MELAEFWVNPLNQPINEWMVLVEVKNSGPAQADGFHITLDFGRTGVVPIGQPIMVAGWGHNNLEEVFAKSDGSYDISWKCLLRGDTVTVLQRFRVDEPQNSEWRLSGLVCEPSGGNDSITICAGGFAYGYYLPNGEFVVLNSYLDTHLTENHAFIAKFLEGISVTGENTEQEWSWPYPGQ